MSEAERQVWVLAYVSVMSIRLHPRNAHHDVRLDVEVARDYALCAARMALDDYKEYVLCHGELPQERLSV